VYLLTSIVPTMNSYEFVPSPEVAAALAAGKPVVALESTIISHGLPRPSNLARYVSVLPMSSSLQSPIEKTSPKHQVVI